MKLTVQFHLPHQPDRWALLATNAAKLLNWVNQCYVSLPHLKSGIYVSNIQKWYLYDPSFTYVVVFFVTLSL
jgi:hypothetical protein